MSKPVVAIVGRPNVGKSTLFNRITGETIAIVEDTPGITRDRLYQEAEWSGREFILVDTGGLDFTEQGEIMTNIRRQAEIALQEADVIVFTVDARTGITSTDQDVAALLRKNSKNIVLAANKVENFDGRQDYFQFYKLGLGEPIPVSAAEGLNTGELLDRIVDLLPTGEKEENPDFMRIAVIGRPNVGKSSLVNALIGQERVIVSNIPGTTRDAIDTFVEKDGQVYNLIDTAGMRRKSKIELNTTERYSIIRSLRAIDRCQVALLLLEATEGVTEQDKKIAGYAHERGKALVIVVNKWDLIQKDDRTSVRFTEDLREELPFLSYAPILFISALTRQRVGKVLDYADSVFKSYQLKVSTPGLNNLIKEAVLRNPPPSYKSRKLKIYYVTQTAAAPPRFIFQVNDNKLIHFSYRRYLENQIRQAYGFEGTPIWFSFRNKNKE